MNERAGTVYLDYFDEARQAALHPYRIVPGTKTKDEIFANVNYNVYYAMGSDKPLDSKDGVLAAAPLAYKKLLGDVLTTPGVKFLTAFELSNVTPEPDQILCHVRHDVDADIVAALHLARIEHELGIRTTYYLLHTAAYYGTWGAPDPDGIVTFSRNECMADVYLELQRLGHEVAIHTDSLTLYQQHNVDGAAALVAELEWLRSIGLDIRGTAPHNNYYVYGADNSAIFNGRNLRMAFEGCPKGVIFNGRWAPLQKIDEQEHRLTYEANQPFDSAEAILEFFSIIKSDLWWQYHQNTRGVSGLELIERKAFWGTHHEIMNRLMSLYPERYSNESDFWLNHESVGKKIGKFGGGQIVIIAVHPEYYGRRCSPSSEPIEAVPIKTLKNPTAWNKFGNWLKEFRS